MLAAAAVTFLISLMALALAVRAYAGRRERRRVRAHLGPAIDAAELGSHERKLVTVRGMLSGGELSTRFGAPIATIRDVHPDATSSRPEGLRLRAGKEDVVLLGATQVVLGEREERVREGGGCVSLRRVSDGVEVLARGFVTRSEDGGYRDDQPRFSLAARSEGAWTDRAIAIAALERSPTSAATLAVLCLTAGVASGVLVARAVRARGEGAPPTATACGARVLAMLDRNDVFGAERELATCDDARARAETMWSLGRVDAAAHAFEQARRVDPTRTITLSEAEATLLAASRPASTDLLRRMQHEWYRGLPDPSQRTLECIAGSQAGWTPCHHDGNLDLAAVPVNFGDPVSVVTDTMRFARDLTYRRRTWDDPFGERCDLLGCRAAKPAGRARRASSSRSISSSTSTIAKAPASRARTSTGSPRRRWWPRAPSRSPPSRPGSRTTRSGRAATSPTRRRTPAARSPST